MEFRVGDARRGVGVGSWANSRRVDLLSVGAFPESRAVSVALQSGSVIGVSGVAGRADIVLPRASPGEARRAAWCR